MPLPSSPDFERTPSGAVSGGREARVAVIGGGISGLSAAHRIRELSGNVTLFEASSRLGGLVRTEHFDGACLEHGPDTLLLGKPAGAALCHRLDLEDELVPVRTGRRSVSVLRRGRLVELPSGFAMMAPTRLTPFVRSPLFSTRAKLRIALERFLPARPKDRDESLRSFVTRRFGREAFERVAEPILASLFTADGDRLSMRAALPRLLEMERRHGSVTRALCHARRQRRTSTGRHALSYADAAYLRSGFERLPIELRARLPLGAIVTGSRIRGISREPAGTWTVETEDGYACGFGAIVLACPSFVAADLVSGFDHRLADDLARLRYASCATVNLAYRREDLTSPLESFGFFVPRTEGSPLLAVSFVSSKFEKRIASDRVLVRAFLGGALRPAVLERDDDSLARLADEALRRAVPLTRPPLWTRVHRLERAMPQFELGFPERLASIRAHLARRPGLFVAGSAVGAFGVPDCVASGERAAKDALDHAHRAESTPCFA